MLAARFGDVGRARLAIAGLQSSGIDGDDIRWLSPFPEEPPPSNRTPDRRITRFLVRRVLVGALVGAVVGGFVGGLLGGALVAVTSPASAVGEVVALVAVGAVIGTQAGAYVGFERAGTLSEAWSTTFDELESGAIWIGVRTRDPHDLARARRALERERPIEVREL